MKAKYTIIFFIFTMIAIPVVWAGETVDMHKLTNEGTGETIGTVTVSDTDYGTLFTPELSGLLPGMHGFHVHEKGECGPGEKDGKMVPGLAAGGHYDPDKTGSHKGPYEKGHKGDLPALYVDSSGAATYPVLAPRIKLSELKGHAIIIHQGGDNYSDTPEKLGGGGARIACGVVK
ncbi:MAG: superoxide dismutase [Cu-Zn] SodC [Desulforhopalus sp.]